MERLRIQETTIEGGEGINQSWIRGLIIINNQTKRGIKEIALGNRLLFSEIKLRFQPIQREINRTQGLSWLGNSLIVIN